MQTRRESHEEIITNQVIGIISGLIVMYFLLPLIKDLPPSLSSPITVFTMFVVSYVRGYSLRRYYNRKVKL